MIKINLLPQQKRAKVVHVEKDALVLVIVLITVVGAILGVDFYTSSQISDLSALEESKINTKKQLEMKVSKVNSILKELEAVKGRIKTIKDIRLRQGLPVRYIDDLVVNIPKNKMWLDKFNLGSNGQVTLSGVVLDNQSFAEYVERLRGSKYIGRVDTQRTSRKSVEGLELISFQCSVTVKEYFENNATNGTTNG